MLAQGGLILRKHSFAPERIDLSGGIAAVKGLSPGPLEGGWKSWLKLVHREDLERYSEMIQKCWSQGGPYELEYRLSAEKKVLWVREQGLVTHDLARAPIEILALVREISEIQDLESRLSHAQKMEAFGKLAGGVAHDFNNMLGVILGYSELVLGDLEKEDPNLGFIEEIGNAARRASSLTSQLLAFTHQEVQGTLVLTMDEILKEMGKMLGRLIGEQIQLTIDHSAGEAGRVLADRNQIEQLLIHLSICARDLLPSGGFLTLHTRILDREDDGAFTPGAPQPELTGKRFLLAAECRALASGDQKTTSGDQKTTPGEAIPWTDEIAALTTCESIVTTCQGSMRPGGYRALPAALAIFFPLVVPLSSAAGRPGQLPPGVRTPGGAVVLFVEDDKGLRNLGRVVLTRMGYRVIEAENGQEGLKAFNLAPPGEIVLVITDIIMPTMGGRALAEQINARDPALPVIFISGYPEQFQEIQKKRPPATHSFLRKPFPMAELTDKVKQLLG